MHWDRDDHRLTASDVWHALGSLLLIIGVVFAVAMFTATVYERPSTEAEMIIQAGKTLVETVGR